MSTLWLQTICSGTGRERENQVKRQNEAVDPVGFHLGHLGFSSLKSVTIYHGKPL